MRLKSAGGWADASDVNEPFVESAARFNEHDHGLSGVDDGDLVDDRRVRTGDGSGGWMVVRGIATPGHTGGSGYSFSFEDAPGGDPGFIVPPVVSVRVATEGEDVPLLAAVRGVDAGGFKYVVFVDNGVVGDPVATDCVVHWAAMGRVSGG